MIDEDTNRLRVTTGISSESGVLVDKRLKTKRSRRTVVIPDRTLAAVRRYREHNGVAAIDGLLFTGRTGGLADPETLLALGRQRPAIAHQPGHQRTRRLTSRCSGSRLPTEGCLLVGIDHDPERFDDVVVERSEDREATDEDSSADENPDIGIVRRQGAPCEAGGHPVTNGRELQEQEVGNRRRTIDATLGRKQQLEPVEELLVNRTWRSVTLAALLAEGAGSIEYF